MTGQNSARHRVTQFISPESKNAGPQDWKWEGLTSKDVTLPSVLRSNGYHTIFAGKAHFAPIGHEGEDPTKLGFDINIAGCSFGAPGSYLGEDGYGNLDPKRKRRAIPGLEKYHKTDTFLSEAITLEAKMPSPDRFKRTSPSFCTCLITQCTVLSSPIHDLSRIMKTRKSQGLPSHLPL
jgi:arylsulfatase A-like enzyme